MALFIHIFSRAHATPSSPSVPRPPPMHHFGTYKLIGHTPPKKRKKEKKTRTNPYMTHPIVEM